jgi:hypothetical protein
MKPDRQNFAVHVSRRIYRWLLRAFPRDHRLEWADSMEQLFRDCAVDAFSRSGYFGLAALWLRTLGDYATSIFREYWRPRRPASLPPSAATMAMHPMNNFTPRAQHALALARKEADRFGHNYVGTEHVLLGILTQGQNVGIAILKNLGVDERRLREAMETRLGPGTDQAKRGGMPFAPRVKKVLALAGQEAMALDHSYLGCEHILVALALVEDGLAKVVLQEFGVNAARCRAEIRKVLSEKLTKGKVRFPNLLVPQKRASFEGEGKCIRQNDHENIYGRVCLRLILIGRIEPPPPMRVTFDVTEKNLPNDQWALIQHAIQGWWRDHQSAFGQWLVVVDIVDASWWEGATPAFDHAAVAALKDAVNKAAAAGLLPGEQDP